MKIHLAFVFLLFSGFFAVICALATDNSLSCVRDCQDVQDLGFTQSGVYSINPGTHDGYDVYCDMETDGGGWLIFQRRTNDTVDFDRVWNDYELGFGEVYEDFWLGNILLHIITSKFDYQLRVDLQDWDGNTTYAKYKIFKIGNVHDEYRLGIGGYSGNAGDSLNYHNGKTFHTKDKDINGCAIRYFGGWWFGDCHFSNLNGEYMHDGGELPTKDYNKVRGISWQEWRGKHYSLKTAEMKIKRL